MPRRRTIGITSGAAVIMLLALGGHALPSQSSAHPVLSVTAPPSRAKSSGLHTVAEPGIVHIEVVHTQIHVTDDVLLRVDHMHGRMLVRPGSVISLDDLQSFRMELDEGVTRLSAHDLAALLNSYLLKNADSSIHHIDLHFEGQTLVIKGEVHKLVDLPFEGRGTLSPTANGELRLRLDEFKVAGVVNKNFLSFFGIHIDRFVQPKHQPTFHVEGNDLISPISSLFPPPAVSGKLTRVRVEGQDLVQTIGDGASAAPAPDTLQGYVYFKGGRMSFGRLTMDNVDLRLVDRNKDRVFDFSLAHYQDQIKAGYSNLTPELGLVVYAEDYNRLGKHPRRGTSPGDAEQPTP